MTSPAPGSNPSNASSPTLIFVPGIVRARSMSQATRSRLRATASSLRVWGGPGSTNVLPIWSPIRSCRSDIFR